MLNFIAWTIIVIFAAVFTAETVDGNDGFAGFLATLLIILIIFKIAVIWHIRL